jgi:hypothetical protein
MAINFPSYWDAPSRLLMLDGCCGPVTAWGVLKYFGKRVPSMKLVKSCHHTKKHGTFLIALAVALREFGLTVSFYSELDPNPTFIERRCLLIAERAGVRIDRAIGLNSLLGKISPRHIPVVLYNTPEDNGHISPLLGINSRNLALPYTEDELMPKREFLKRWSEPGIFRQCLVASIEGRI